MQLFENISMALASVKSNKLRSTLTMLGIIIGIAAVIAIKTVGNSLTREISDNISSGFGASNITVSLQQKSSSDNNGTTDGVTIRRFMDSAPADSDLITQDMIDDFTAQFGSKVTRVDTENAVGTATISKYGDPTVTISANVTAKNAESLASIDDDEQVCYGRWISDSTDGGRYLATVSEKFVEQAIGGSAVDAVGKQFTLTINDNLYTFYIVGVYKYKDNNYASFMGASSDDDIQTAIYIPMQTAADITGTAGGYRSITVVANAEQVDVTSFVNTVGDFFASYYTRNDTWTASASSLAAAVDIVGDTMNQLELGISAIAALSLLVGGIGVMNIMMVSVTERTREIGTRKALGAPASAIRMQFITESVILCLIGGAIGVILGLILGSAMSGLLGYAAHPDIATIVLAVGFSMAIGVFFGYYPANKAAKLDPIEALRYE